MMLGLIQDRPLVLSDALAHAALFHGRTPVVSRRRDGSFYHSNWADIELDGWFGTGDIASIDADGYLKIADREKDLVKSGGEWISSIDVENAAGSYRSVREAAVIAVPHERWGERPVLLVVPAENAEVDPDAPLDFLRECLAKWWVPDRVVFVSSLPKTGTGKVMKTELRKQFAEAAVAEA